LCGREDDGLQLICISLGRAKNGLSRTDSRKVRMVYKSRIPADADYVQSLGQAFYNFTYLEAIVVSVAGRLGKPVSKKATAGQIAKAFEAAISEASPPLSPDLKSELMEFRREFSKAIGTRNMLLHARTYTAPLRAMTRAAASQPERAGWTNSGG
jgi:hypothetical protein